MEWYWAGLVVMAAFLVLLSMGLPVSLSFFVVGGGGLLLLKGPEYLSRLPQVAHESVNNFVLTAIPLYILVAETLSFTGISQDLYDIVERWFGRLPGGLAVSSIVAATVFGGVSGSSAADAAAIGGVSLPQMVKRGYSKRLAAGSVAAGGTLALMVPPSMAFIIYGFMAQQSIPKLFMAGIVPGIMLGTMFAIYIMSHCLLDRNLAPLSAPYSWRERFSCLYKLWPILLLMAIVLIGIYRGFFTPAEAASVATVVALCYAAAYRRLTWGNLKTALLRTVLTSGFVLFIIMGALTFATLLAQLHIPRELSNALAKSGASPLEIFVGVVIVYIILGMFLEGVGMMSLTIPIIVPVMAALGFNLIWFGVVLTLLVEKALITPPVGVNCYVIAGIGKKHGVTLEQAFVGILPFMAIMLIGLVILYVFPQLPLWLPAAMQ